MMLTEFLVDDFNRVLQGQTNRNKLPEFSCVILKKPQVRKQGSRKYPPCFSSPSSLIVALQSAAAEGYCQTWICASLMVESEPVFCSQRGIYGNALPCISVPNTQLPFR